VRVPVISLVLSASLLIASEPACAQYGGGGGHGHGGRGNRSPSPSSSPPPASGPAPENPAAQPMNKIEIVGVVTAIGPEPDRLTIAYDAVEALNWPAGTMPFVVARPALLKEVTVGEKVRFKLESEQISELGPVSAPKAPL
jgi:Cu/Ag efflux protein CusF